MVRILLSFALIAMLLSAVLGSAASLEVDGGTLQVFSFDVTVVVPSSSVDVSVEIKPESLDMDSKGDHVTANLLFPDGYDADDVDQDSVRLCPGDRPCGESGVAPKKSGQKLAAVTTSGESARHDLALVFDRGEVIELLQDVSVPSTATLTVSGLIAGQQFAGSDTIDVNPPSSGMALAVPTGTSTALLPLGLVALPSTTPSTPTPATPSAPSVTSTPSASSTPSTTTPSAGEAPATLVLPEPTTPRPTAPLAAGPRHPGCPPTQDRWLGGL